MFEVAHSCLYINSMLYKLYLTMVAIYTYLSGLKFLVFHPLMTYLLVAIINFPVWISSTKTYMKYVIKNLILGYKNIMANGRTQQWITQISVLQGNIGLSPFHVYKPLTSVQNIFLYMSSKTLTILHLILTQTHISTQ